MIEILKIFVRNFLSSKKKHFLILLQNNNELRSTGGFITSVFDVEIGRLRAKKNTLNLNTDLYNHKKVDAPKPIKEMLYDCKLDTWTLRDANYYPDFSKSAKKIIEFYNLIYPQNTVCGLMAVNYSFAESLFEAIGKIKIGDKTVDRYSLFDFLSSEVSDIDRHDIDALNKRKNALNVLARKIMLKTLFTPWKWYKTFRIISQAFKEKDLQLYDINKNISDFIPKSDEDFLAVIENNYLGMKSNRYIRRSVFHDSNIDPENKITNELKVIWEHFGTYNYPLSWKYRAHVRFYLPKHASMTFSNYDCEEYEEDGLKVLSFKLNLNPKEKTKIHIRYELPKELAENSCYKFRFFKQPGVKNELLRKAVTLPDNYAFSRDGVENILLKDVIDIKEDCNFDVRFQKSTKRPRIYSHNIIDERTILIKFNEPVYLKEEKRIDIADRDEPDKKINVDSVKLENDRRNLIIKVKDLPPTPEKFYTVKLNNIFNENDVGIEPNPRSVTVVYRPRNFKPFSSQRSM